MWYAVGGYESVISMSLGRPVRSMPVYDRGQLELEYCGGHVILKLSLYDMPFSA